LFSYQHQSHIELLDGCHWYRLQTQQGYFEHTPGFPDRQFSEGILWSTSIVHRSGECRLNHCLSDIGTFYCSWRPVKPHDKTNCCFFFCQSILFVSSTTETKVPISKSLSKQLVTKWDVLRIECSSENLSENLATPTRKGTISSVTTQYWGLDLVIGCVEVPTSHSPSTP